MMLLWRKTTTNNQTNSLFPSLPIILSIFQTACPPPLFISLPTLSSIPLFRSISPLLSLSYPSLIPLLSLSYPSLPLSLSQSVSVSHIIT